MNVLELIKKAMLSQGTDESLVNSLLFGKSVAVLVKTKLPAADMVNANKGEEALAHTSAIAITTRAMNIFVDEKTVYLQDQEECLKSNYRIDVVLLKSNLSAIKRDFEGEIENMDDELVLCNAHVGFHYKSKDKNQMYIGKTTEDSKLFTDFRKLLVIGDTLVILKLIDGKYCVLGFPVDQMDISEKVIYQQLSLIDEDEAETFFSTISKLDYDEQEFTEDTYDDIQTDVINSSIDLSAYENASVAVDTSKECLKDLSESNNIRLVRKNRHDRLVAYFGRFIEKMGYSAEENKSVDLLFKKDDKTVVLCEMKTLNGGNTDLRAQALKAFSQLFYYKMYKLGNYSDAEEVKLAVVFEDKISNSFIDFFQSHGIVVFWQGKDDIQGTDAAKAIFE